MIMMGTPKEVFGQESRLKDIGLSVPPITALMNELAESGLDVPSGITDIKLAKEELYRLLSR